MKIENILACVKGVLDAKEDDKNIGNRIDEIFETTEPSPERLERIGVLLADLVDEYGEDSNVVRLASDRIMTLISMGE